MDTRWSPESGSLLDEWSHKVVWAAQSLPDTPSAQTAVHGRWLVLGNADLAAELGRGADVLDSDSEPAALARALSDVDYVLYAPPVPPTRSMSQRPTSCSTRRAASPLR
ncbi:phthiocerol/phenolphthiocerol synthesis polyketide synthase type I PpsB domain protein [Mycobacterium ulcerans str. Harvey]|uniref:Phthiocerol/phenolphthiocerol synthesis polyketide synthase type I PpsB domain protein n=1 Tax=Mycobacterium ulcerans str. Harvey TaxID=1299332 RepID=A0ABP3AHS5_MYCUL|nr:phthiocerol/phenolphthiocerol synthesis polyketide synthase type I PpsB domain protein [Mycobacterium ulcerans str. Harvey]